MLAFIGTAEKCPSIVSYHNKLKWCFFLFDQNSKQSEEIQENFKKFEMEMILTIPWNAILKNVDVRFQDEARFGQRKEHG